MLTLKTKVSSPHYKACAEFYERIFGLTRVEAWDKPGDKGIILALGAPPHTAFIELYSCDVASDLSGTSLQFKVDDLSNFLGALPKDIAYDGPTERPWGARYAYLIDPAGVAVVVFDGPTY